MKIVEIRKVLEGVLNFVCPDDVRVNNISIDSRSVQPGDIFFGLKGERTDGNLYAADAIERGAQLVIVDNLEAYQNISMNKIYVKDTLAALKSLGAYFIYNYKGKIISITGSVGKTTTKSMLYDLLNSSYRTYSSYKNYNNELGVAISACNMDMSAKYAIFELGTNSAGEITDLANYVKADAGIVTSIGFSHIGRFGDKESLAKEKMSLADNITTTSLWINGDTNPYSPFIRRGVKVRYFGDMDGSDIQLIKLTQDGRKINYTVTYKGESYDFKLNHIYSHLALNSLPCIAIALDEGVDPEAIADSLAKFVAVEKRGQLQQKNGLTVVDDCYNAGFQSVISAVKSLAASKDETKVAIIGEMAEIEGFEDELYTKLEETAEKLTDVQFVFCGEVFSCFADRSNFTVVDDKAAAFEKVKEIRNGIILVKASRGQRFEEIVNAIMNAGDRNAV